MQVSRSFQALVVVVLGIAVALLLVPIQQYSFDELTGGKLPYAPDSWCDAYVGVHDRLGEPLGLSPYYFWGHFAFLMYVAGFVGARALPRGQARLARLGRGLLVVALAVGLVGDLLAYWGGTDQSDFTMVSSIGFGLIEIPALLLTVVGMVVYGLGLLRERGVRCWPGWVLVAGGALALPGAFVITYVPHGVLVTILGGIGLALLASLRSEEPAEPVAQ